MVGRGAMLPPHPQHPAAEAQGRGSSSGLTPRFKKVHKGRFYTREDFCWQTRDQQSICLTNAKPTAQDSQSIPV